MKYRSRIDIICQILGAANGSGVTRSKIAYGAFINYDQLKENLTALVIHNLLAHDKNADIFRTTEKGLRLLQLYNEISDLIKADQPPRQVWMHR